jgi:hypothetical protein
MNTLLVLSLLACRSTEDTSAPHGGDFSINGWRSPLDQKLSDDANFAACGADYFSGHRHLGGDYMADEKDVVYAMAAGKVVHVSKNGWGEGNVALVIQHTSIHGDFLAFYGHIVNGGFATGDTVVAEQPLGTIGDWTYGDHLHLGVLPGTTLPSQFGMVTDDECDSPEELNGFVAPYSYLKTYAPSSSANEDCEAEITYTAVSPDEGTQGETEFVWTAIAEGGGAAPELTLSVLNPSDGETYDFEMEPSSSDEPWVFTYQKTLNEAVDYTWWVELSSADCALFSTPAELGVDEPAATDLSIGDAWVSPDEGSAGITRFTWTAELSSEVEPEVELKILNAEDAYTYTFEMGVEEDGDESWVASYDKRLSDAAVYTWWIEATDGESTVTSEVSTVRVEATSGEDTGGDWSDSDEPAEDTGDSLTVDLDPGSISLSDSSPEEGDTVKVKGSIDNDGTGSSGSFTVGIYLSSNSSYGSSDTLLETWTQSSIGGGSTGSYSKNVDIPSGSSGSGYVLVVVDPSDDVEETNESDNTSSTSITIDTSSSGGGGGSATIDLDPGSITLGDSSPAPGDTVSVKGSIDNDGTGASGSFTVGVYLSSNSSFGSSDTLLSSWTESSISAGSSGSYSESVAIPSSATGSPYILVVADPSDSISESDESDNTSYSSISIDTGSSGGGGSSTTIDLDPGSVTVSDSTPTAGDTVTVKGSIDNDGTGSSGSFTVGVYLSSNSSFGSSDTLLTSWTESSISAGSSGSYSESVTLPSTASSSADSQGYYLLVVADPSDTVSESDESDNTSSRSITVGHLNEAVDSTDHSDWGSGSSRDIFEATSVTLSDTTGDPEVTAVFEKVDGSKMKADKSCHVRVGSYSGSYSKSLDRVAFTWAKDEPSATVTWSAWKGSSNFAGASLGDTKDFYLVCEEPSGDWNHWRTENPVVIEVD